MVLEGSSKPVLGWELPVGGIETSVDGSEPSVGAGGTTPDSDPVSAGMEVAKFVDVSNVEEERESEGTVRVPVGGVSDDSSGD